MLLQGRQRRLRILPGGVLLLCLLLVFSYVLLMVDDHMFGELLVEGGAIQLGHLVVIGLLLGIRPGRRGDADRLGCLLSLGVGGAVVGNQGLAERLDLPALSVLLGKLAHLNFGEVPFDRLGNELLA